MVASCFGDFDIQEEEEEEESEICCLYKFSENVVESILLK